MPLNPASRDAYDALHRALLAGLLSNIALKGDTPEYTGAGGQKFFLWPGSGLAAKKPKWIVAAELVETTRRYARTAARINPAWVEPLAPGLVKRTHSEPRWDGLSGRVIADEKVTLYGLPIVPRRVANYGPIEPGLARTLFIQHGLVEGDWQTPQVFFAHNRALVEEINEFLTKTRRLDLLRGEAAHFLFYDERLPADVYDAPTLARALKQLGPDAVARLRLTRADLVKPDANAVSEADFPPTLTVGGVTLPLDYHLEPGSEADGVTVVVPREAVNQLRPERLGWLVPGLLAEKAAALIRSLPKNVRTAFVPVPETARQVVARLKFGQGDVEAAIAAELSRIAGERVTPAQFDAARLPVHLRMNVRVVDDAGTAVAAGRNLAELQAKLGGGASAAFTQSAATGDWHRDGLTDWVWDTLPASVPVSRGGVELAGHPTVVDAGETVALRLLDNPETAARETRRGLRRLFLLSNGRAVKTQTDHLPNLDRLLLNLSGFCPASRLRRQVAELMADRALFPNESAAIPRTAAEWKARSAAARNRVPIAAQEVGSLLGELAAKWGPVRLLLEDRHPPAWAEAVADVKTQVAALSRGDFLTDTPWPWLSQFPRYLAAIAARFGKLAAGGLVRDRQLTAAVAPRWQTYLDREIGSAPRGGPPAALIVYRWMLEEYRVSLFAQPLGTAVPVSEQRLDKQWAKTRE